MIIGIILSLETLGGSCHLLAFCTSVAIELRLAAICASFKDNVLHFILIELPWQSALGPPHISRSYFLLEIQ